MGQKIAKLKFAKWTGKIARIAELKIVNEKIFILIAELKNAK